MKIEAGRYYKTRDGRKVGPLVNKKAGMFNYHDTEPRSGHGWYPNGRLYENGGDSAADLISEWPTLTPHQQRTADMIKVMQAYVDGEEIEVYDEHVSLKLKEPSWSWATANYRIAPTTTQDELDWSLVNEMWKYRARDSNGRLYFYENEPYIRGEYWAVDEGEAARVDSIFVSYRPGTCDWKGSLVKRPDNV